MPSLYGGGTSAKVVLTVDDGGAEDGSPTAAAAAVTISCARENYTESVEAVTTADTGRCDTWEFTGFIRSKGTITVSVPVQADGTCYFGEPGSTTGMNRYKYIARTYGSGSAKTFLTAIRSNSVTANEDNRVMQNVTLEIQGVS